MSAITKEEIEGIVDQEARGMTTTGIAIRACTRVAALVEERMKADYNEAIKQLAQARSDLAQFEADREG